MIGHQIKMSFLFTITEENLQEELPILFDRYQEYISSASELFKIEGFVLEELLRNLPNLQVFYSLRAQEMKQLMRWIENYRNKLEAEYTRNYTKGPRVLGVRETVTFINGESAIIELNQLIIEATLLYSQLADIVEGFKQMGWMLGSIVKLRISELHDVIL